MTKLIGILIVVVLLYGGWQGYLYWERVKNDDEARQKELAKAMNPAYMPGMPGQLEQSYANALQKGNAAMREWLKVYGASVEDPRRAWIEMDFCVAITRENPPEARRIFRAVKERVPASSPLQVRIKQLEKSYE